MLHCNAIFQKQKNLQSPIAVRYVLVRRQRGGRSQPGRIHRPLPPVVPAQAEAPFNNRRLVIQRFKALKSWIPACAGMTSVGRRCRAAGNRPARCFHECALLPETMWQGNKVASDLSRSTSPTSPALRSRAGALLSETLWRGNNVAGDLSRSTSPTSPARRPREGGDPVSTASGINQILALISFWH